MKTAAILLLSGCAAKCKDCISLTPKQLFIAVEKGWVDGYNNGFDAGEDTAEKRRLKGV